MRRRLTHGVIGNTSDFGSAESWFEPRWVNRKPAEMPASVFDTGPKPALQSDTSLPRHTVPGLNGRFGSRPSGCSVRPEDCSKRTRMNNNGRKKPPTYDPGAF